MTLLRNEAVKKMDKKEKESKLKELRTALVKSQTHVTKGKHMKTKEIKKAIARILTAH